MVLRCRYYERKFPKLGDITMVKVQSVSQIGANVDLLEYNIGGIIPVTELPNGHSNSIKELVSIGATEPALVVEVDEENGLILVSKRRKMTKDLDEFKEMFEKSKIVNIILMEVAELLSYETDEQLEELYQKTAWRFEKRSERKAYSYDAFKNALVDPFILDKCRLNDITMRFLYSAILNNMESPVIKINAFFKVYCFTDEDVIKALEAGRSVLLEDIPIEIATIEEQLYEITTCTRHVLNGFEALTKAINNIKETVSSLSGIFQVKKMPETVKAEVEEDELRFSSEGEDWPESVTSSDEIEDEKISDEEISDEEISDVEMAAQKNEELAGANGQVKKDQEGRENGEPDKITYCVNFSTTIRQVYGPFTTNQVIVNHISQLSRCQNGILAIPELEMNHPAIQEMVYYAKLQEKYANGGVNFVLIFCGELFRAANELLKSKILIDSIIGGFQLALDKALDILNQLCIYRNNSNKNKNEGTQSDPDQDMIKNVYEEDPHLLVYKSYCYRTKYQEINPVKVIVYKCPITYHETPDITRLKKRLSKVDYFHVKMTSLSSCILCMTDDGNVAISVGKPPDEYTLNNLNYNKILFINLKNHLDMKRICAATKAIPISKVYHEIKAEKVGKADKAYLCDINGVGIGVFKCKNKNKEVQTVVVEDFTERTLIADSKVQCLPGGAATAIELAMKITDFANGHSDLKKKIIKKFADALEIFPITLAKCKGIDANDALEKLYAAHRNGKSNFGINTTQNSLDFVQDTVKEDILEDYDTYKYGLKHAYKALVSILLKKYTDPL